MSTDRPAADVDLGRTDADDVRDRLDRRLGEPPTLSFPEGWINSSQWHRAQAAPAEHGPTNPAEFTVLMGYTDDRDELGDPHTVLFALYQGDLRAECDCRSWTHHGHWCAHVAYLWWQWTRGKVAVTDLDADRTHLQPPAWLRVDDESVDEADETTTDPTRERDTLPDLSPLTPAERAAYVAVEIGGMGPREFQRACGLSSPGTISNALAGAREKLARTDGGEQ